MPSGRPLGPASDCSDLRLWTSGRACPIVVFDDGSSQLGPSAAATSLWPSRFLLPPLRELSIHARSRDDRPPRLHPRHPRFPQAGHPCSRTSRRSLSHPAAFGAAIDRLERRISRARGSDVIAAAEARGFIFGAPLALRDERRLRADPQAGQAPLRHDRAGISARIRHRQAGGPHRRLRAGPPRPPDRRRAGHRRHDARLPRPGPVDRRRGRRLRLPDRALVPGRPRQARARAKSSA